MPDHKDPLQERYDEVRNRHPDNSAPQPSDQEKNMLKEDEWPSSDLLGGPNPSTISADEDIEEISEGALRSGIIAAQSEHQNNQNYLMKMKKEAPQASKPQRLFFSMLEKLKKSPVLTQESYMTALEELCSGLDAQDKTLRALSVAMDKYDAENKALTKKIEGNSIVSTDSIGKLQEDMEDNNTRQKEFANLKLEISELEKKLKETNRQLAESEATKAALSSSLDATNRTDISTLKSRLSVLERELAEAQEGLQEKSDQAKKIAAEHDEEVAKIHGERDDLAIENTSMAATFGLEKEELVKEIKRLKLALIESKGSFRSWLRLRPPQYELPRKAITIRGDQQVEVIDRFGKKLPFEFDRVFAPEADNTTVFRDLSEILESAFQGHDITILAYGQTGSGKTYTMSAMLNMALKQIFTELEKSYAADFSVKSRCVEIYNDKVYDLFKVAQQPLRTSILCTSMWPVSEVHMPAQTDSLINFESVQEMVRKVEKNRRSGQTVKNYSSSRSHMFLSFQIQASRKEASGAITTVRSAITFVDLAGSESMKEVEDRTGETQAINSELSALKTVLTSMGNSEKYIPFRNKQLTRLLQDGFDKGKVLFIQAANIAELEQSIHTMDFGGLVSKCTQTKSAKNLVTEFAGTVGAEEVPRSKPGTGISTTGTERGRSGVSSRTTDPPPRTSPIAHMSSLAPRTIPAPRGTSRGISSGGVNRGKTGK